MILSFHALATSSSHHSQLCGWDFSLIWVLCTFLGLSLCVFVLFTSLVAVPWLLGTIYPWLSIFHPIHPKFGPVTIGWDPRMSFTFWPMLSSSPLPPSQLIGCGHLPIPSAALRMSRDIPTARCSPNTAVSLSLQHYSASSLRLYPHCSAFWLSVYLTPD